ncbi:WecB/TagA/CpsF family glycosyltransferase [Candidatus Falkowbacteria bacterium]|nr:WecB/TagA/CpsF family glycosyltransferase [Candidatus Falkowbacteria bacterium]
MNKLNILGINISTLNKKEVLEKIEEFLLTPSEAEGADGKRHQIVTPNPEFLLAAQHDEEFFYILNNADLAVPDGIGLKFASWCLGENLKRISGADLVKDILHLAEEGGLKVAIANWDGGLSTAEDIKKTLKEKYPKLQVVVEDIERNANQFVIPAAEPGSRTVGAMTNDEYSGFRVKPGMTGEYAPDILFSTLGAPWQDKFIFHALKQMPSVKLGMGVGGSFDFLTGKIKRAPLFLRFLGLEWLWRLAKQPWRRRRIYNAVVVFPAKFLKWKFWLPLFYRSNVVCLVFKKVIRRGVIPQYCGTAHPNEKKYEYKILVVERQNESNHWQLPQGGMDGENIKNAGRREVEEELGIKKINVIKIYKNLYKYDVRPPHAEYTNRFRSYGYRGQKQSLVIAEFLGRDEDIKINFWDHSGWKWIDADNLVNEVHPIRREATKIFLEKFKTFVIPAFEPESRTVKKIIAGGFSGFPPSRE